MPAVQILISRGDDGDSEIIYALRDDGSIWRLIDDDETVWVRLPDLPESDRRSNPSVMPG